MYFPVEADVIEMQTNSWRGRCCSERSGCKPTSLQSLGSDAMIQQLTTMQPVWCSRGAGLKRRWYVLAGSAATTLFKICPRVKTMFHPDEELSNQTYCIVHVSTSMPTLYHWNYQHSSDSGLYQQARSMCSLISMWRGTEWFRSLRQGGALSYVK